MIFHVRDLENGHQSVRADPGGGVGLPVVGYLDRNAPRGGYAVELLSNLFNLFEPHKALERFTSLGCTAVFGTP